MESVCLDRDHDLVRLVGLMVYFDYRGEPDLIHFGLARRRDQDLRLTPTRALLGTPAYMAPDQVRGDVSGAEHARDIYSLGVVLYEAVTARPPFTAEIDAVLFHLIL